MLADLRFVSFSSYMVENNKKLNLPFLLMKYSASLHGVYNVGILRMIVVYLVLLRRNWY